MRQSAKSILQFEYNGLRKIISGGQIGSDLGGLIAAQEYKLETGGTAPQGWKTCLGPKPELAKFNLCEHTSSDYKPRTRQNILDADATLIISSKVNSPGTVLTISLCKKLNKPYLLISNFSELPKSTNEVTAFIMYNQVSTLNVAGNRDARENSLHYTATITILRQVFKNLENKKLLIKKTS